MTAKPRKTQDGPEPADAPQPPPGLGKLLSSADEFIGRYHFATEKTFAKFFGEAHAKDWRYDPRGLGWYTWNGVVWEGGKDAVVAEHVSERVWSLSAALLTAGKITGARLDTMQTTRFTEGIVRRLRTHQLLLADQDPWDGDIYALGTPGGVVDLRTGAIRPARPEDFITKLTSVAPAPKGTPYPLWSKFLDEITQGDKAKQRFLQQWAGIGLSGDVSERYFVNIHGPGSNGKSVYVGTLGALLGEDYHRQADLEIFLTTRGSKHSTGIRRLKGARMVTAIELEEGRSFDNQAIKSLTGGDKQVARFMRKDNEEFWPTASISVVGNHLPILTNVGPALRARVLVVEFLLKLDEADMRKHLRQELIAEEGSQILRWAIEGAVDWQANGFQIPESVRAPTEEYFEDEDEIGAWLAEACEIDRRPAAERGDEAPWFTSYADLFTDWSGHARRNGRAPGTKRLLNERLAREPELQKDRTNARRGWSGIRLRAPDWG